MAELTKEISAPAGEADYYEDEFGLSLKIYLGARFIFYVIGIFMILGALLCVAVGITNLDDLVSSATGYSATSVDVNFSGYQICMYVHVLRLL